MESEIRKLVTNKILPKFFNVRELSHRCKTHNSPVAIFFFFFFYRVIGVMARAEGIDTHPVVCRKHYSFKMHLVRNYVCLHGFSLVSNVRGLCMRVVVALQGGNT